MAAALYENSFQFNTMQYMQQSNKNISNLAAHLKFHNK
jgi:hypothetical protein